MLTKIFKDKKDLLFKFIMTLVIAAFVVAMYFNAAQLARRRFGDDDSEVAETTVKTENNANTGDAIAGNDNPDITDTGVSTTGNTANEGDTMITNERSFGFMLYDTNGNEKAFTEYRGSIVFMLFWEPNNTESVDLYQIIEGTLPDLIKTEQGDVPISLITVRAAGAEDEAEPGELTIPADTEDESMTGGAAHFYDKDSELARIFMIKDYPATYVFNPKGELSGYYSGQLGARRIEGLIAQASGA